MDAATLTSVPAVRRNIPAQLARRVRALMHGRDDAIGLRVDESRHVDAAVIDPDTWIEWGDANLTPVESERRRRAVEADQAAQRVAAC